MTDAPTYLDVSPQAGARFFGTPGDGPVVMLNLLRFRARADYAHAPDLEPQGGASGAEAYARYMAELDPLLVASGGEVLFAGKADAFLIGPEDESWDFAMLVKQASKASFLAFASDPAAQRITQHRTAAVCDSRLLPLWPGAAPA
ncbi:DUF1330 domain-containing protein [Qipengyuania sp. YG27]|uniref:DUF1330 domain-containing protein n=1 Tax=Qipengyuania mesophila TaxID=2867246 RepID=A0ABS7JYM9_9SPHN|nr:DUF1330 domain-containing protein [Qipengyuania mesophila]MBX7502678.1 DUF1330 domain-containing protein [Qipengyuania mesophila]